MNVLAIAPMTIVLILILALIISIGVFVYKDAPKHGMDPVIWTLISVLVPNLIGFIIYLVVRSGKKEELKCSSCGKTVDSEYVKCPYCGNRLKGTCSNCGKAVNQDWESCPYCSTNIDKSNSQYSEGFQENMYHDNGINYDSSKDKKNKNKGLKIIIGIFIALIVSLFILIIGSFVAFNSVSNVSIIESSEEVPMEVNELLGKESKAIMKSSYAYWDGTKIKGIKGEAGEEFEINYSSEVKKGDLQINLYDIENNLIEKFPTNTSGTYIVSFEGEGEYLIEVIGKGTKGSYSFEIKGIE
jgi:DNA-directed RNA polymerase subunit RPC12/RpoP